MNAGDLYIADVPFRDRPGQKDRIVLILRTLSDTEVLVVESRGKPNDFRQLIGVIDFSRRGYLGKFKGQSHFYHEHLRILHPSAIKNRIGALTPEDFRLFFEKLKPSIQKYEGRGPTPT